jgi:hypothetical protein
VDAEEKYAPPVDVDLCDADIATSSMRAQRAELVNADWFQIRPWVSYVTFMHCLQRVISRSPLTNERCSERVPPCEFTGALAIAKIRPRLLTLFSLLLQRRKRWNTFSYSVVSVLWPSSVAVR